MGFLAIKDNSRHVKWHENRGSVTKKQLWSCNMNFCKKVTKISKFLLLGSKGFCKAALLCHLRALKTSISLGTWFLYRVYPIRKPSVAVILHSLFTYTSVRDDPNDNWCTNNIDNQYCLLLNILGDTLVIGLDSYSRPGFIYLDPILIYISLWIDCLFEIRKIAVCFLWLSLPGDYRVTDEALLAETT